MKRIVRVGVLTLAGAALILATGAAGWNLHRVFGAEPAAAPARAKSSAERRILATLDEMLRTGQRRFGVPEADGRRLRLLAEVMGAKNVVEIGTSTGYSTLWLALGVLPAQGRVSTFEIDSDRAQAARRHLRDAGVDQQVTVVVGDAHQTIAQVEAPIDLVFLDADKGGYTDYLSKLLPRLRPGGLILAHNADHAPEYLRRVAANRDLETVFLTQGSALAVTMKKR